MMIFLCLFRGCTSSQYSEPVDGFLVVWFLCPGAPKGLTDSGSGFKASQKTGQRLKISSNRLGEPGIKLPTPGYKGGDLSTI